MAAGTERLICIMRFYSRARKNEGLGRKRVAEGRIKLGSSRVIESVVRVAR